MPGVSGIASSAPTPIPPERPDARNACCGMRMRASGRTGCPGGCWTQWIRRPILIAGLCASVVVLTASQADADIGVIGVKPNVAAPGQLVDVAAGCGGLGCPVRLPVSLLPSGDARGTLGPVCEGKHGPCRSPTAPRIPRERPYVFLGWAARTGPPPAYGQRYVLRFRVPSVKPGAYEFVIFCDACSPGPRGMLVATFTGPNSGRFLEVRPEQRSTSNDGGADRAWLIAGPAALLAIAAAAVLLRRRRGA